MHKGMRLHGKPLTRGYETMRVAPFMPEGVDEASAKIQTPFGLVQSSWTWQDTEYRLETDISVGVAADIHLPGVSVHKVGSGRHSFTGKFG